MNIREYRNLIAKVTEAANALQLAKTGHEQRDAAVTLDGWLQTLKTADFKYRVENADIWLMSDRVTETATDLLARKRAEFAKEDTAMGELQ